jgi:cytochrome P450
MSSLREIPGPSAWKSLSFFNQIRKTGFLPTIQLLHAEYGERVQVQTPVGQTFYFVSNLEDVRSVLQESADRFVKGRSVNLFKLLVGDSLPVSDGEVWKNQRRLLQPMFYRQYLESYTSVAFEACSDHVDRWCQAGRIEILEAVAQLTHDIVARALFGADLGDRLHSIQSAWREALGFIVDRSNRVLRLPLSVPIPRHRRFSAAMAYVNHTVDGLIQERLKQGASDARSDMLTRLIQARDQEGGGALTDRGIRDQILAFLFAGHDTTANNLSWTLYLLLKNPAVQDELRQELESLLPVTEAPDLKQLAELPAMRRVVYESLRLYPPAPIFVREAIEDVDLSGYRMRKGGILFISPYVIQRRADLWPEADGFIPGRFKEELPKKQGPLKFIAFGYGARACIGEQFALMEAQAALVTILRSLKLELETPGEAGLLFNGTLRPTPLEARVERRIL